MAFVNTTVRDCEAVISNIGNVSANADYINILLNSDNILINRIEKQWFNATGIDETFSVDRLDQTNEDLKLLFAYHGIASIYRNVSNVMKEPDAFERLSDKYFRAASEMFDYIKISGFPYDFETIDEATTDTSVFSVSWKLLRV